jgi:hypothetical protein
MTAGVRWPGGFLTREGLRLNSGSDRLFVPDARFSDEPDHPDALNGGPEDAQVTARRLFNY